MISPAAPLPRCRSSFPVVPRVTPFAEPSHFAPNFAPPDCTKIVPWVRKIKSSPQMFSDASGTPCFRPFSQKSTRIAICFCFPAMLASAKRSMTWKGTAQSPSGARCSRYVPPAFTPFSRFDSSSFRLESSGIPALIATHPETGFAVTHRKQRTYPISIRNTFAPVPGPEIPPNSAGEHHDFA